MSATRLTEPQDNRLTMQVTRTVAPVREQVLKQLRQAIIEMLLPPGRRLVERELIEQTGVSRTTIREVLRQLAAEGLVTTLAHKGTVVATIPLDRAMELYEIRAVLEGMAARQFAQRASDKQMRELRRAFEAIEAAGRRNVPGPAVLLAKKRFYDALFEGADNLTIREVLEGMQARVTALRSTSLAQPGRSTETVEEVRAIVVALEARDGDRAAAACAHHVTQAAHTVRSAMNAVGNAQTETS